MHLTLKKEATKPPEKNLLQQQEKRARKCTRRGFLVMYCYRSLAPQAWIGRITRRLAVPTPKSTSASAFVSSDSSITGIFSSMKPTNPGR
jgi:hypothetical protein